ncbi:MAG: A/G-specific adenine glycosylase [Proteobacteria bacterium]|nr:A/G-specific adenine glycosylase [Cystobacterineae bacterium]MCL2315342.1 A/G-specific adenine glycosylase [Pseudomonadota bacterium]
MTAKPSPAQLLHCLETWYAQHGRQLPWRNHAQPYAIWVSEVMLQQTQVGTVVGYFGRFMRRFPNLQSLAAAPLDEVLSLWQGLGYYGRCRKLHAAAQQLVSQGQTQLPSNLEALLALPGFGPYTAGAVASMAFGLPVPAIDGNLLRVFARLYAWALPKARLLPRVQRLVEGLLHSLPPRPSFGPGSLNQALMDLGATVCKPHRPHCTECPWSFACLALSQNKVSLLPLPTPSKPKPILSWLLAYIELDGHLLMAKHPPKGLFGGLWGLPGVALQRRLLAKEAAYASPLSACLGEQLPTTLLSQTQRVLTHRRLQLFVYAIGTGVGQKKALLQPSTWARTPEAGGGQEEPIGYECLRWVPREMALQLPSSAALRKALEAAMEKASQISVQRL